MAIFSSVDNNVGDKALFCDGGSALGLVPTDAIFVTNVPMETDHSSAMSIMDSIASAVKDGKMPDVFWLLEHPSVYTSGRSAGSSEVLDSSVKLVPVYRGGKVTYHGPGQKILYIIMNLKRKYGGKADIRRYVRNIEDGIISFLSGFGILGCRRTGLVGIWVADGPSVSQRGVGWAKIASVGVGVSGGITTHGCGINVSVDLSMFSKIIPCGISNSKVCSIGSIVGAGGGLIGVNDADINLSIVRSFASTFGVKPVIPSGCPLVDWSSHDFPCCHLNGVLRHFGVQ